MIFRTQDFEEYKLERQKAQEAIEKFHSTELKKLRAEKDELKQTTAIEINDLRLNFNQHIQQILKSEELLRISQAKKSAEQQALLEKNIMDLKEQQKKTITQVSEMSNQQEELKRKHEKEKKEQESRFSYQLKEMETEKKRLEEELKNRTRDYERRLAEQLDKMDEKFRIKQLADLSSMTETKISENKECKFRDVLINAFLATYIAR